MRARHLIHLTAAAISCAAIFASPASAAGPSCGTAIKKSTGGYWTCSFADDFNGSTLNRANWQPMTTATMGYSQAGECYVDDPAHISVANGMLTLSETRAQSAASCGWFATPYQSGMVFSSFSQTYGRFEARVKFPKGTGFASGFWMWPRDMAYGQKSGEIDVAEHYGAYPTLVSPHVHIVDGSTDRGKGAYCNVTDPSGRFHTYTVEWLQSGGFRFMYDGITCMTMTTWDPGAPLAYPQPFDQRFFMALTAGLGYAENAVNASTPFPGRMQIDYVRAWK